MCGLEANSETLSKGRGLSLWIEDLASGICSICATSLTPTGAETDASGHDVKTQG